MPGRLTDVKPAALGLWGGVTRLYGLDALRGIAALVVAMIYHVFIALGGNRTSPLDGIQPFTWLHDYGWSMVDLFFVISGYVFAHVYRDERGELKHGTGISKFALARFARLYPLHLATLLIVLILAVVGVSRGVVMANNDAKHFLLNILFLQWSGLNDGFSYNNAAWSLSVEAYCYALFIVAAAKRWLPAVSVIVMVVGAFMANMNAVHEPLIGRGLVGYFVGYWLWRGRNIEIPAISFLPLVLICLFASTIGAMRYPIFFSLTMWPVVVRLSLSADWLSARPFQWLGERSYAIYLIHSPLFIAQSIARGGQPAQWPGLMMALNLVALLALADLSYRLLERPAQDALLAWPRMKRRKFRSA